MSSAERTAAAQNFNEMHGLIVNVGKYHCRKPFPLCEGCPLKPFLPQSGPIELTKKVAAPKRLTVAKKRH